MPGPLVCMASVACFILLVCPYGPITKRLLGIVALIGALWVTLSLCSAPLPEFSRELRVYELEVEEGIAAKVVCFREDNEVRIVNLAMVSDGAIFETGSRHTQWVRQIRGKSYRLGLWWPGPYDRYVPAD